jgi:hypothetical protein
MTRLELIEADDPAWDRWIGLAGHDVYHTAGYHRVAGLSGEGTPQLLVFGAEERFVAWPYLLQGIPNSAPIVGGPAHDVTSTYGYSGPVVVGCEPGHAFVEDAWHAFRDTWIQQHVVSVFTRFHPILGNHRWFAHDMTADGDRPELGVQRTGETVSIDPRLADGEVVAAYPRSFRQEIAQSRRKGLRTEVDADWRHLETFIDLYTETMRRNHAHSAYFLGRDYFLDLKRELGDDLNLFVGMVDGTITAACLFMSHHGIVHPHLAGTSTAFLSMSPLKVMWDDVRHWAAARGDWIIHLGGGRGGQADSLFDFKARFSPNRHDFHTGRWVLDRVRFDALSRVAETGSHEQLGYFPPYRAPRLIE